MKLSETIGAFYRAVASDDPVSRATQISLSMTSLAKAAASMAPGWLKDDDGSAVQFAVETVLQAQREAGNGREITDQLIDEACARIQRKVAALPFQYKLQIPIALGPNEAAPEHQILAKVRLTSRSQVAKVGINSLFGEGQVWDFGGPSFQLDLEGYAGAGQSSDFADAASRLVKRAIFATVTAGIATIQKSTPLPPAEPRLTDASGAVVPIRVLSSEALGLLSHLHPGWGWKTLGSPEDSDLSRMALEFHKGVAAPWLDTFSRFEKCPEYQRVGSAIDWWADSHSTKNRTHAYIYACIGLEALLGDHTKQRERLTDMLCDRAAFLLGDTDVEREDVAKQIAAILKVRGQIMHGKAPGLTRSQERSLDDLHELLARALRTVIERAVRSMNDAPAADDLRE